MVNTKIKYCNLRKTKLKKNFKEYVRTTWMIMAKKMIWKNCEMNIKRPY